MTSSHTFQPGDRQYRVRITIEERHRQWNGWSRWVKSGFNSYSSKFAGFLDAAELFKQVESALDAYDENGVNIA